MSVMCAPVERTARKPAVARGDGHDHPHKGRVAREPLPRRESLPAPGPHGESGMTGVPDPNGGPYGHAARRVRAPTRGTGRVLWLVVDLCTATFTEPPDRVLPDQLRPILCRPLEDRSDAAGRIIRCPPVVAQRHAQIPQHPFPARA